VEKRNYISCPADEKIFPIPERGAAVISGYWNPSSGARKGYFCLRWVEGKIVALDPVTVDEISHLEEHNADLLHWENYALCPGFIDAHVHLALDSVDFYRCLDQWQNPPLVERRIEEELRRYLECGVVAIRDGGDGPGYAWNAKQRVAARQWLGPEIVAVREAVAREGMYGRFLGRGFRDLEHWQQVEAGFYDQGADQLKVIVTGIVNFAEYGKVGPVQWSPEELRALVRSAHRRGLKVMAHASGEEGIRRAIEAGVDSIEHGYYMTTDLLEMMLSQGIAWVPTVAPIGNCVKYPSERHTEQEKENLARILEGHLTHIYKGHQMGVLIGIGTDAGAFQVPHGASFADEIMWAHSAGISLKEVYRLATEGNAQICGLKRHGKIEIGSPLERLQLIPADYLQRL